MSLALTLSEMKDEVLNGLTIEEAASVVCPDHEINPVLAIRKFRESFKDEDAVRAYAVATSKELNVSKRVEREVARLCGWYKVPVDSVKQCKIRGVEYKVICRDISCRVRQLVAVSMDNGFAYRVEG